MNYHIAVNLKANPLMYEFSYDMDLAQVRQTIVQPYVSGNAILINGKRIEQPEIGRLQVIETEHNSSHLLSIASGEVEREGYPSTHPMIKHFPSSIQDLYRDTYVSLRMMNLGTDVTDHLIRESTLNASTGSQVTAGRDKPRQDTNVVFVVHGRNEQARTAMFEFLRAIGLQPLEWSQAVNATGKTAPFIGEILNVAFSRAHAVVVLMTPDDVARLRQIFWKDDESSFEMELTSQARPNVLFEAGMAMGRHSERTILVELGALRPFSDVAGRHVIRLDNSSQRRQDLAQRLQIAGCPVILDGRDWHTAGDFASAVSLDKAQQDGHPQDQVSSQVESDEGSLRRFESRVPTEIDPQQSQVSYRDVSTQVSVFMRVENHLDIPATFKDLSLDIEFNEGEPQRCRFIDFQQQPFPGHMADLKNVVLPPRQEVQGWAHFQHSGSLRIPDFRRFLVRVQVIGEPEQVYALEPYDWEHARRGQSTLVMLPWDRED